MGNKKLLFVASRQFWPTTGGKEITLFFNCKGLHEHYGYDIYLFCFADKNAQRNLKKPSFIKDLVYADIPSTKQGAAGILKHSFFGQRWPLQNSLYYKKEISDKLIAYCEKVCPDAVVIDMVRLVPYADDLLKLKRKTWEKIILIEDDLLAKRYRRQLLASSSGSMAGQYSKNLPSALNRVSNIPFVKKTVLKLEADRLEKYERTCIDKFDYITFISPVETAEFNEMYHTLKGITLTMGADVKYYAESSDVEYEPNSMSIVANFTTAANADSIDYICSEILPKLSDGTRYYVMGRCPDEIKSKYEGERIRFLGFVDDIRPVAKATTLYLSPMAYGTGIKTKIVEAMAMRIPVVTNAIGAEGLDVHDGEQLFICETDDEIVERVKQLFSDKELRERIASTGQKFVLENHTWEKVYEAFGQMGL